jgi:hypothetical protein
MSRASVEAFKTAEDEPEPAGMFRLNSRFSSGGEELFEPFVPEPLIATPTSVTYMVTISGVPRRNTFESRTAHVPTTGISRL